MNIPKKKALVVGVGVYEAPIICKHSPMRLIAIVASIDEDCSGFD